VRAGSGTQTAARRWPERPADSKSAIWRQNSAVPLSRIAWSTTVVICVVAAVLVLLNGYVGYFFVLLAVGASAAINLR
jgi:hypothetical protein